MILVICDALTVYDTDHGLDDRSSRSISSATSRSNRLSLRFSSITVSSPISLLLGVCETI